MCWFFHISYCIYFEVLWCKWSSNALPYYLNECVVDSDSYSHPEPVHKKENFFYTKWYYWFKMFFYKYLCRASSSWKLQTHYTSVTRESQVLGFQGITNRLGIKRATTTSVGPNNSPAHLVLLTRGGPGGPVPPSPGLVNSTLMWYSVSGSRCHSL